MKKNMCHQQDYGTVFMWFCELENVCANLSIYADGQTPMEIITGETHDILQDLLDVQLYEWSC